MSSPIAANSKKPDQDEGYIVYHGSLTRGITSFNPGSHFGTFKQALVCIGAHAFIDGELPILPTLYKCRLKLKKNNIYRIVDWGSPNLQAALMAYLNQMAKSDLEKKNGYIDKLQKSGDSSETIAFKLLNKEMLHRGHRSLPCGNELNFFEWEPSSENINIILTINWDTPTHQSALIAYLNQVALNDRKKKSKYLRDLQSAGTGSEILSLEFLYTEIAQRGHRAFSYHNKVESIGKSVMALYSEDVEILESWEPCRKEIIKVFSKNIQRLRPPNLESAMQKAVQFKDGII